MIFWNCDFDEVVFSCLRGRFNDFLCRFVQIEEISLEICGKNEIRSLIHQDLIVFPGIGLFGDIRIYKIRIINKTYLSSVGHFIRVKLSLAGIG